MMRSYSKAVFALLVVIYILTVIDAKPKEIKGTCFARYSQKSGCRKFILTNGARKSSIEECCRSGGLGWSKRKKDRKKCISCDTVDTSFWGEWGEWSECSATCGESFKTKQRKCISKGKPNCRGMKERKKKCKKPPCPVDGAWTEWSPWGSCSVTCLRGTKIRRRACENPTPQYGGKECIGKIEDWAECEMQLHCPINGGWGEWGSWSTCSKTCDLGTKTRKRVCNNPLPKYGGIHCDTLSAGLTLASFFPSIGQDYCREERCNPRKSPCDDNREECASGSGSKWTTNSGSGSGGDISGSGFSSSGFGSNSGEDSDGGSGGDSLDWIHLPKHKKKPKFTDDEDLLKIE